MTFEKKKNILICTGGSAGHIFPAIDFAKKYPHAEICFAGHGLSKSRFFDATFKSMDIDAASFSIKRLGFFLKTTVKGFFQAIKVIKKENPDFVLGFGSYHTFPLMLASVFLRKKIYLFESNVVLGKVNYIFSPFAKKVFSQFPLKHKLTHHQLVQRLPWKETQTGMVCKKLAAKYFGLKDDVFTILVFGGSQGAAFFNDFLPFVLDQIPNIQVLHFTGKNTAVYKNIDSCVKEFESQMNMAYRLCDIAITRSGAGTISELISYQVPAFLVPYPFSAEQHQLENAKFLSEIVQGAVFLEQNQTSKEKVLEKIQFLRDNFLYLKENLFKFDQIKNKDIATVFHEI